MEYDYDRIGLWIFNNLYFMIEKSYIIFLLYNLIYIAYQTNLALKRQKTKTYCYIVMYPNIVYFKQCRDKDLLF